MILRSAPDWLRPRICTLLLEVADLIDRQVVEESLQCLPG